MFNSIKKNPIIFSALILIFFLYSSFFNINIENKMYSLINTKDIESIECIIKNSPIKTSDNKYYSCDGIVQSVSAKNKTNSSAFGIIKLYIPSKLIESYFPGKLYSRTQKLNAALFESGGIYKLNGKYSNNKFYVTECTSYYWANSISGKISYLRALSRLQFKRLMYSWGNAGGLFLALLCGAKEYTEESISFAFRQAGLSHILALSGMHLSLFSGIAMFIGKKSKRKKLSFIIRIFALIIFVWFAGFSPSLLRAFICAFILLFCSLIDVKNPDMLIVISLSFIIQCIINPQDIYTLSFILSYSALCGIIIFNKFLKIIYTRFLPNFFATSLASSTSAQLFTIPISFSKFGVYSPIGIISTCFISPLITFFIYTGLLLFILSLIFPFISNLSGIFMNFVYTVIKEFVFVFAKAPVWSIN